MFLENINIVGFRGINRLSLALEDNNLLIGENAWGKSSLLDALTLLLTPGDTLYRFTLHDFHFPPGNQHEREHHVQIVFTFCESELDERLMSPYQALLPFWRRGERALYRLRWCITGEWQPGSPVTTLRDFIDDSNAVIAHECAEHAGVALVRLQPVLRLRDARFTRRGRADADEAYKNIPDMRAFAGQLENLTRELITRPQNLTDHALQEGLKTMQQLLAHYFSLQQPEQSVLNGRMTPQARELNQGWQHLNTLNQLIADADSRSRQLILLRMFTLLARARGETALDPNARPLLLVEDPETRLHPIMLSVAWGLLTLLPIQKVITTNSAELLSQVPVEKVCRLVRESQRVASWRIGPGGMSAEDSRRIAFHIRFSRPSSLFARCWLLVEGETEVWVMNELARQCGYHFEAEGIKVIEFAQSGLRPLLKFAQRMGIEWHVLTDGDDAGKKYAATARSMLNHLSEDESLHLTMLPALDMEHFLYKHGFSNVYHRMAQLPAGVPMNLRRIIAKAIQRSSKPELAIAVALEAAQRGTESIPSVMCNMFKRVLELARGQAD
nr:ATP-dependent endonuclease [Pantoea sp. 201603H]